MSALATALALSVLSATASAQLTTSYSPVNSYYKSLNHSCSIQDPVYSCENTTAIVDTCCVPTQGLVLTTQFWSVYTGLESQGQVLPKSSWTIHGLWSDYCDGSYDGYFDFARQYDPYPSPNKTNAGALIPPFKGGDITTSVLEYFGRFDLLQYITKYWVNQGQPNWVFWQHEFSKHATGFSTFDVGNNGTNNCYGPTYKPGEDIIDFVDTVVRAQKKVPTYDWLAAAGILPSNTTTYPLKQIQDALTKQWGAVPYLGCSGPAGNRTQLSEVWYYAHSLGRPQDLIYKPVDQTGSSSCSNSSGIHYYLRASGSEY